MKIRAFSATVIGAAALVFLDRRSSNLLRVRLWKPSPFQYSQH